MGSGLALQELSKDKPIVKVVETHTQNFISSLQAVETSLERQILYLT